MERGIDVSENQGKIDWKTVKSAGVKCAIIRAGWGRTNKDPYFDKNVKGCIENDIPFGIYWFIYGVNETEAIANADKCHAVIAQYKDKITMKVWCDFEYDTDANANKRGVVFDKAKRTSMVKAFCERMKALGYEVGVYANPDYLKNKFNDLSMYPLWLAYYGASEKDAMKFNPVMWQYSSKGYVSGISGNVDMNYVYMDIKTEPEVPKEKTYPILTVNSKGREVKVWQAIVETSIDGKFGNNTKKATIAFQRKVFPDNPNEWDGIVGVKTWEKGIESLKK
jgi:GH25 family lysozyme M1 (1,4-beta-N-acetylmuramidase)